MNNIEINTIMKGISMKLKIYSIILFINNYISGLLAPVLSLLLLEKGATISNLSIILGLYALTVIVLELPTGIIADVYGRKISFVISIIVSIISFLTILLGKGFIALSIGMILYGLSRALSSGSFDAMFIDYYIDNYGKDKIHNITTRLSVIEALGMSAGALSGGFIPAVAKSYFNMGTYDLNVIIRLALAVAVVILSYIFIEEQKQEKLEERITIRQHVKNSYKIISKNSTIVCIFISVFSTGLFLSSLETYWQPYFIQLIPNNDSKFLLGLMAFLYFAAATLGSIASNKIIKTNKFDTKKIYITMRILLALSLILTALQTNVPVFIALYSSIYLLFGLANVPEGAILNKEIPSEVRASVLSVYSLAMQIGGLTGSFAYSILINYITIPQIWMTVATIMLVTVALIAKTFLAKSKSNVAAEIN